MLESMTATETRAQNQPQDKPVIQVDDVSKLFRTPSEGTIGALQDVSLTIPYGEFITVA